MGSGIVIPYGIGLAGWMMLAIAFATLPGPLRSLTTPLPLPEYLVPWLAIGGWLLLVRFFRAFPADPSPGDVSPGTARLGLAGILAFAAVLRLYRFQEPLPQFWTDYAYTTIDAKSILDFRETPLLMNAGFRTPAYQYFVTLVIAVLPGLKTFAAQTVGFALMDLVNLWIHYLLGREVGGRSTGLILAAWMAVSKPVLVLCMTQQTCATGTLALGLALLFTLRLMKDPRRKRFLQWGLALGAGAYFYQSFRPFLGFIPVAVLAGLLWKPIHRPQGFAGRMLALVAAALWVFFFLLFNRFLPLPGCWTGWKAMTGLLAILLLLRGGFAWIRGNSTIGRWMEGLATAWLVMLPIVSHPQFASHVNDVSSLHRQGQLYLGPELLATLSSQFRNTLSTLFVNGWDHTYMSQPGETFLEYASLPWMATGLALLAARPNRLRIFLFICVLVGMVPHGLSQDPHSGKLQGIVTPLALLGVMAMDRILQSFRASASVWPGRSAVIALVLYLLGAGAAMAHRFYVWLPPQESYDHIVYRLAKKDVDSGVRPFLYGTLKFHNYLYSSAILCQDLDLGFIRGERIAIPLDGDQPVPDVAVYFHGKDEAARRHFLKDYANHRTEGYYHHLQNRDDPPDVVRVWIPANSMRSSTGSETDPRITYRRYPSGLWKRRAYIGSAGLDSGLLVVSDRAERLDAPFETGVQGLVAHIDGTIRATESGNYVFMTENERYVRLTVDGKRIMDLRPKGRPTERISRSVRLEAGDHLLKLQTFFRTDTVIPSIRLRSPDGTERDL